LDWGYYSAPLVKSDGSPIGNKFTKIISLNSIICYNLNWESTLQFEDPGNMLQWLENEL
jgi:hypothetical protein